MPMLEAAFIAIVIPLLLLILVLRHSRPVMFALTWGMFAFYISNAIAGRVEAAIGWQLAFLKSVTFLEPPIREACKALPLFLLLLFKPSTMTPYFYVLGATVGIGFGIIENLYVLLIAGSGEKSIFLMTARSFSACLTHAISTGLIGVSITLAQRHRGRRLLLPIAALLVAVILHGFYNFAAFSGWVTIYVFTPVLLFVFALFIIKRWELGAPESVDTSWS